MKAVQNSYYEIFFAYFLFSKESRRKGEVGIYT